MSNQCPQCGKGELLLREISAKVSVAGLFGAFAALIGLILLFFNPVFGILVIIAGLLIGYFGRGKHTESVCPLCGYKKKL